MATTPQPPASIEQVIHKLSLLPLHWKLQIATDSGIFYITDISQIDECTAEFVLEKVPPEGVACIPEVTHLG